MCLKEKSVLTFCFLLTLLSICTCDSPEGYSRVYVTGHEYGKKTQTDLLISGSLPIMTHQLSPQPIWSSPPQTTPSTSSNNPPSNSIAVPNANKIRDLYSDPSLNNRFASLRAFMASDKQQPKYQNKLVTAPPVTPSHTSYQLPMVPAPSYSNYLPSVTNPGYTQDPTYHATKPMNYDLPYSLPTSYPYSATPSYSNSVPSPRYDINNQISSNDLVPSSRIYFEDEPPPRVPGPPIGFIRRLPALPPMSQISPKVSPTIHFPKASANMQFPFYDGYRQPLPKRLLIADYLKTMRFGY